jgi:sarcosine oxidase
MTHVDVAVVGRGMIGSAAARHLAAAGHRVTNIGPDEPTEYAEGPFASHFDQGRVTRITAFSEPWGAWARASIDRYAKIEEQSGISFHDPVGLVVLADSAAETIPVATALGADAVELSGAELQRRTGIVSGVASHRIVWEGPPAGLINPRLLVKAQTVCAQQNGANIVADVVEHVDTSNSPTTLTLRSGEPISADQVIVCTGAYGAELAGVSLPLERRLRTIALAELGPGPDLPTLIIDDPPHASLDEAYWVPPVEFSDGRWLLKIGGDSKPPYLTDTNDPIDDWFRSGASAAEAEALFELLEALLPDREVRRIRHKPCVVSYTPSGRPHLDRVSDTVTVAFGGCGAAAKSSDEIGRIAAEIATS